MEQQALAGSEVDSDGEGDSFADVLSVSDPKSLIGDEGKKRAKTPRELTKEEKQEALA